MFVFFQAFWVCHNKQQDGFLCPNGTMFNQRYFTCDWWFNVRCPESPDYYELNKNIGVVGTRIDTVPAGVVGAESRVHPVSVLPEEGFALPGDNALFSQSKGLNAPGSG